MRARVRVRDVYVCCVKVLHKYTYLRPYEFTFLKLVVLFERNDSKRRDTHRAYFNSESFPSNEPVLFYFPDSFLTLIQKETLALSSYLRRKKKIIKKNIFYKNNICVMSALNVPPAIESIFISVLRASIRGVKKCMNSLLLVEEIKVEG